MKVENQVTSLEQSRDLLRLGISSEKASMVWTTLSDGKFGCTSAMDRTVVPSDNVEEVAFTVFDLLDIVPYQIRMGSGSCSTFAVRKLYQNTDYCEWDVSYTYRNGNCQYRNTSLSLVDALVEVIVWLEGQGLLIG